MSPLHTLLGLPQFREGTHWKRRRLAVNETIFREGDGGDDLYLILRGKVRVLGNVDLDDHRRVRPGFGELSAGEVCGELPMFDGEPRSATVVTISECEVAEINGKVLLDFLDHNPEIGYPIFKELIYVMVHRLRAANRKIFSLFAWGLKAHGIDSHL